MDHMFFSGLNLIDQADSHPKVCIRSIFPEGFEFPDPDTVQDDQIHTKLETIYNIMEEHCIFFDLCPGIPSRLIYEYFIREVLNKVEVAIDTDLIFDEVITGCEGLCDNCFQKVYCEIACDQESGGGNSDLNGT